MQDVRHDRTFAGPDVATVEVAMVVETRDAAHADALREVLRRDGLLS